MGKSLTRLQVRSLDSWAINVVGVPGVVLMENAGRNAAEAIESHLVSSTGSFRERKIAIVAGAGNNAGDGFVIARHLAMRGGEVVSFLISPIEKLTPDAAVNLNIIRNLGQDIRTVDAGVLNSLAVSLENFDLVVDALGGTGIRGPLRGALAEAVEQINQCHRPVVAVDIPTGLDCDSGLADGPAVRAVMTVTFLAAKKGFDKPASKEFTGQVVVADIGVPADVVESIAERQ